MTEGWGPADVNGGADRVRPAPGTPCWVNLRVRDLKGAQDFYGALFGWEFREGHGQLGPYLRAVLHGGDVAGIERLPSPPGGARQGAVWTPYLASPDVDAAARSVYHCGGTVGVGPLDADDTGRLVLGLDPAGAPFGILQPAGRHRAQTDGVPGVPSWHDLLTFDASHVTRFYELVFGLRAERTPDAAAGRDTVFPGDEVLLTAAGRPVAGVRGLGRALPDNRGPHWRTCFHAPDVDKAAARVVELGGRLLEPPLDGPRGRIATVADPEGARFSLLGRPGRRTGAGGSHSATGLTA